MTTATATPKEQKFEFYVAGVQHHDLKTILDEVQVDDCLLMIPEPTNKYDRNAVKLVFHSYKDNKDVMIGYVPGKISAQVSAFLTTADGPACFVTEFTPSAKPWNQIKVEIKNVDFDHLCSDDSELEDIDDFLGDD